MDRYQRVEKPKAETPINENEIRITTQGRMRNYITYATTLLQEKGSDEIALKAMGRAINKTVMIAELIKFSISEKDCGSASEHRHWFYGYNGYVGATGRGSSSVRVLALYFMHDQFIVYGVVLMVILLTYFLLVQPGNYSPCISGNNYFVQEGAGYILYRVCCNQLQPPFGPLPSVGHHQLPNDHLCSSYSAVWIIFMLIICLFFLKLLSFCRYQLPIPAEQVKPWVEHDDDGGKSINFWALQTWQVKDVVAKEGVEDGGGIIYNNLSCLYIVNNSNGVLESNGDGGWDGGRYAGRGRGRGRSRNFRGRGRGYGVGNMRQGSGGYYNDYGGGFAPAQGRAVTEFYVGRGRGRGRARGRGRGQGFRSDGPIPAAA
ncbi:hypothetical protein Pint_07901 [Pistacia integerrima]|uniref:Uncharacterized protein n=1 Tax=Pistacia integerrima TaxID=434235 RepID=A0ACC0XX25_9ROSI|nr:hypothetical protein Pint_07901 [Pistacia integerrima]